MADYNFRTKSWKDQAKLNVNDADEIARLLGAVDLRFQPGQQPSTFEPLNEDEPADEIPPDNVQQQQQPQDDDEYGFVIGHSASSTETGGNKHFFDPEDDFDNTRDTTTYHNRPRPKLKPRARRLDTIQEEDEELDTDDELLATHIGHSS
ncbi:hypothetical protein KCU93_g8921, partial [Aureobasidium melanogenum]